MNAFNQQLDNLEVTENQVINEEEEISDRVQQLRNGGWLSLILNPA
jgi:hypothetical protein